MSTKPTITAARDVTPEYRTAATEWAIWDSLTHTFEEKGDNPGEGKFFFDYADNFEERVLILKGRATLHPTGANPEDEALSIGPGDG